MGRIGAINAMLDATAKMAERRWSVDSMALSQGTVRTFIEKTAPDLFMLYSAVWGAG